MEAEGKPGRMARRPSLCYGGSLMTDVRTWLPVDNAWGDVTSDVCWVRPRDLGLYRRTGEATYTRELRFQKK